MNKFMKMDWHLTNLENTLRDLINFGNNLDKVINTLKCQIYILEEDNKYLRIEYEEMKVKIAQNEEGEVNPKLMNIKTQCS